jgi:chromosome segregation ATPase
MITWRDLFNFDGAEAATKKAVAQINQLDQAYDNWVKGMKTNKNVLDKSVKELVASMGQLKKGLEQVNPATKENQQAISAASKQVEVSATQYKKLTAALDQTQKELKQLQAEHKKVIEGRKKANAGLSEAEKLRRRLTRAQSEGGKELVKLRTQIAAVNAETRKQVKETMAQSNAYEKLKNNVNKAQLNFKNMAAQFGVNSAQAKRAQKEFDKVDKELRQINNAARDGRRDERAAR